MTDADKTGHQLGMRLVVGGLAVAVLAGLLAWDAGSGNPLGLRLLLAVAVTLSLSEFYALAGKLGHHPMRFLGMGAGLTLTLWPRAADLWAPLLLLLLALSMVVLLCREPERRKFEDPAFTLLGLLAVWLPLSYGMRLRMDFGLPALGFALAAGKGSDILAYFVGSRIGRTPLAPTVSPKKTWEGLGGAMAGGALCGWLVARFWWKVLPGEEGPAAVLGCILGGVGQFSDLAESALKRQASVKDSGSIPALGGMLDMVDSLLLALPMAYYGLSWIRDRPLWERLT